jgi:hypothetical protein
VVVTVGFTAFFVVAATDGLFINNVNNTAVDRSIIGRI